jgi:hypothetical protein
MKLLNLFRKPTAAARAAEELRIARLELLEADAGAEHFKHRANMLRERIVRLEYATGKTVTLRDHVHTGVSTQG